jgi:hypothetical protein
LIDLTLDDSPADKGKQAVGVEPAEAADRADTSAALGVTRPRHRPGGVLFIRPVGFLKLAQVVNDGLPNMDWPLVTTAIDR